MEKDKIDQFLEILNLPIVLGWDEYVINRDNNWYMYFHSLNLITKIDLESVYNERKPIQRNRMIESFLQDTDYHFTGDVKGKSIADVGAGWGHISFWMLVNGAKKVYPIGDSYRSEFIQKLFTEIKSRNLIHEEAELLAAGRWISEGDEVIDPAIPIDSLDYCLFNDVFEHIPFYRLPSVVGCCYNNLKKGGKLISKTHNTNNPNTLREIKEYWSEIEEIKEIPSRSKIITEEFGIEEEDIVFELAKSTRGLVRSQFNIAINKYKEEKLMPDYDTEAPSYDIIHDEAHEGPTDLNRTLSIMHKVGFKATAYPAIYNRRKTRSFQGLAKALPGLFFGLHIFDQTVCFVGTK
jgi:2-polyprenyl-3-methyl-5-hydroxy-6-metoxy-1,4-benzoquinol methylase